MRLVSITVSGFRSLGLVGPIPVRRPTILTGHNDSGKSATLDALSFLLGAQSLSDEDRTFGEGCGTSESDGAQEASQAVDVRVPVTWVEGEFELSAQEQTDLALPPTIRLRRIKSVESGPQYEILTMAPSDERLQNLQGKTVVQLKQLAEDFGISINTDARTRINWTTAIEAFILTQPQSQTWVAASSSIREALPRFLRFGDAESADVVVKAALASRYKLHLEDEDLKQQVQTLETELATRVRQDAQGLIDHIKQRCADLVLVDVEPIVSFTSGLRSTKLSLARTTGEAVSLNSVGAGRARRISLAIWEWTSDVLKKDVSGQAISDELKHVVLAYDEPDTHLDYLQQRRVMRLIREQCEVPGVSMVIATHSMNLIDGAPIEDIVHLSLDSERTRVDSLLNDLDDVANGRYLSDIASALGLRNTVLLHERCFVGVEGATEQQSFPLLFRLSTGRSVHSAGIVIVGCHNNEGALKFIGYLARSDRRVMLIIDSDSRTHRMFSDANIAKEGLNIVQHVRFIGDPEREFESVFSDAQWANVANSKWPHTEGRAWVAEEIGVLRSGKFSSDLLALFQNGSEQGPTSKPSMMYEMAASLRSPNEVPQALRDLFEQLEKLAALDL